MLKYNFPFNWMTQSIHVFVSLHLDYFNVLLTNLDKSSLSHLQALQNAATINTTVSTLTSLLFYILYISSQQILGFILNSCVNTHRELSSQAADYISQLLTKYITARCDKNLRGVHCTRLKTSGVQSLSVCGTKAAEKSTTTTMDS